MQTWRLEAGEAESAFVPAAGGRYEGAPSVDYVIIAGETGKLASAEQAYVSFSRARESAVVCTDDPDRLRESWGVWRGKENAMGHARPLDTAKLLTVGAESGTKPAVHSNQRSGMGDEVAIELPIPFG